MCLFASKATACWILLGNIRVVMLLASAAPALSIPPATFNSASASTLAPSVYSAHHSSSSTPRPNSASSSVYNADPPIKSFQAEGLVDGLLGGLESLLLGPPKTTAAPVPVSPTTHADGPTKTVTITEGIPATTTTVVISEQPITVTQTRTEFETETITAVPTPTSDPGDGDGGGGATPTSSAGLGPAKAIWVSPPDMTDLSSFGVSKFASGKDNLQIVSSVPAQAHADSANSKPMPVKGTSYEDEVSFEIKSMVASSSAKSSVVSATSDKMKTKQAPELDGQAMRLLYPSGSMNPAQNPKGGAEFYATPMDISNARNVTLKYSVFFPANFDWVLAGKLPGMYGGHTGCSGGNAALDCFSTRLMWREGGKGELYLYAPKDKQTDALCSDKLSVCDAAYGLSVGRGSFLWKAGGWTTITQTVYLNTPGKQDGIFTLDVDGRRVIDRNDVFYRDDMTAASIDKTGSSDKTTSTGAGVVIAPTKGVKAILAGSDNGSKGAKDGKDDKSAPKTKTKATSLPTPLPVTKKAKPKATPKPTSGGHEGSAGGGGGGGGLLSPLLGGLLGALRRQAVEENSGSADLHPTSLSLFSPSGSDSMVMTSGSPTVAMSVIDEPSGTMDTTSSKSTREQVKFTGIFFSTFFGGHATKYATPRDQYVWFKDFAMAFNE